MGLIKSKERVRNHAEVYTAEREVNAMLDLVKNECENIESRFLEPACGTGNFLVKILERKLTTVTQKYKSEQSYYERYTFVAVASIYGVDILADNVQECRERLLAIVQTQYKKLYGDKCQPKFLESIAYVLSKNILLGDALSLRTVDLACNSDGNPPITFAEWALIGGSTVKRRDYTLANLLDYQGMDEDESGQMSLLSNDRGHDVLMPRAVAEYPTTHFLQVQNAQ